MLIIVVTEWWPQWDAARKIKIQSDRDDYTASFLRCQLLRRTAGVDSSDDITVEIYYSKQKSFVDLSSYRDNEELYYKFGRLLKAQITSSFERKKAPLALLGRYYPYDPESDIEYCGKKIRITEILNDASLGTGLVVWDGSILLSRFIEAYRDKFRGRRFLELGAGTGYVGIVAAVAGASEVVLTDLNYTMELMKKNIEKNEVVARSSGCRKLECEVLDWFDPPSDVSTLGYSCINGSTSARAQPDVIAIADCVWLEELVLPLMNTVKRILQSCPESPLVIISYQRRGKGAHVAFMDSLNSLFEHIHEDKTLAKPDVMSIFECRDIKSNKVRRR